MEGEERQALAMPAREEVDQLSAFQQLAEAPADDLGNAGAGKALLQHRLRIGEGERTTTRYFDRLVAAHEGPIVGLASMGIEGLTTEESIYQACIKRFRPILMTTMAALLGGVPMMVGTGVGSEVRQPLGYAIVGGLALSQILTLYTTPVVYIYFDKLQTRIFRRRRTQAPAAAEPQPAE